MKLKQLKPTTAKLPKREQTIGDDANPKLFNKSYKTQILKQWQKRTK
ncbi:hypothetical protein VB776_16225 [Arcicella sp. DC2W]|uniref:Uncharacterized protein n=1 Tax=Arcicella gelida TaxID=2984195 RepID=A0ABU5S7P2_9BACT|nr:hypothetical protein [Arcicella sp. DC2W]MEA5404480.1 hypothetical protein [Arcicella sp. DC2W]